MARTSLLPVLTLALLAPVAASAADATGFPTTSSEAGLNFGIVAGGFAFVSPVYEGSDKYRVSGFPLVYPKFYGASEGPSIFDRLTLRGPDDVRFALFKHQGFEVGPVVGYNFGREQDDADLLSGLGDVDGGLIVGGYAGYKFEPFFFDVAYATQVTGDTDAGYTLKFAAGAEHRLTENVGLTASVTTSYASDDYMDAYFSVSPAQSASSAAGLDVYDADGGFKNVGADLALDYRFSERATVKASVGYSRLVGDAADSPVTASQDQFRGGLGFTYVFGRAR